MKLIDKVVTEIERLQCFFVNKRDDFEKGYHHGLDMVLSFLDTLDVKEVDEEYNGKAMLHVLEKGVKQGKREAINRACEWLNDNLHHYWGSISADPHNFLFDFRKAMEE